MDTWVMFMDCPAYLNRRGTVRCALPAEVVYRYGVTSTDGPLECAKIRCPHGHWFSGPVESLTWNKPPKASLRYASLVPTATHRSSRRRMTGLQSVF
jgi:hypothetical protein